jgi:hypothetical protein
MPNNWTLRTIATGTKTFLTLPLTKSDMLEKQLREGLLSLGGIPKEVEENFEVSRFLGVGWSGFNWTGSQVDFYRLGKTSNLHAAARILKVDNHYDFQVDIVAGKQLIYGAYARQTCQDGVDRIIMGMVPAYLDGKTGVKEIKQIYKAHKFSKTKQLELSSTSPQLLSIP